MPLPLKPVAVLALALTLTGCGLVHFSRAHPGHFAGNVYVMWVGEGNASGDGSFLFIPDPSNPLIFTRASPDSPGHRIEPGKMLTDGGSIPKVAQVFNGFSPWGYAPAYMIHDWLFAAHHCIVDGDPDPVYNSVKGVDFDESARILAEAIRALMTAGVVKQNDVAGETITAAVDSVIARQLWDKRGQCGERAIDAKQMRAATAALRPEALARRPDEASPAPAKIVARLSFPR